MNNGTTSFENSFPEAVRENARIALGTDIFMLPIGLLAIAAPAAGGMSTFWMGIILLVGAIVTLLLAAMIGRRLPVSGIWTLGVLFGVKMMCSGVTLVFSEDVVRKSVQSSTTASRMKKSSRVSNLI